MLQDKEDEILSSLSQIKAEETENSHFFFLIALMASAYLSASFTECSVEKCRKCDCPCRTQKGKFLWILIYCPQHCLKMLKVLRPPSYQRCVHRTLRASGTLIHLVEYKSQTLFVLWRTVPSQKCFSVKEKRGKCVLDSLPFLFAEFDTAERDYGKQKSTDDPHCVFPFHTAIESGKNLA